ncbi:MAG: TonB-dependent receptor [Acidobacteriia bacterium]|nr:TonB-dependent receptor [Terriglobia bacterium]
MRTVTLLALSLLLACAGALAQTAQINGTIRDASGLAIPSASVKVTQTATGVVRTTVSGADGGYVLPNLPVGPYLVEVTKDGFSKFVQTGIVLQVDTNPTVDVAMRVGSVSEQVTVEADAAQVETRTTSIGQVVDSQRVLEMPLNGREVHELIFLAGMASYPGTASLNTVRNYPTVVVSVAGGAPDSVSYNLDGLIHQDPYNNLSLPLPFPDALQEFKVETSAIPAQYGFHSTATVNAVTKSGTNQFHGDLFEFLRNGDLNANDFFNNSAKPYKARDTLKRNQYGGTIGGPIKKDKLFFFGGYQRTSLRSDGTATTAFIPTPAALLGDFTTLAGAGCNKAPITLSPALGFTNNQISPALLDPVSVNILNTIPASGDPCGRTNYAQVANQDEDLVVSKVDYQINTKQSLFGRFYSAKLNQSSTYDGKNPLSIASYGFNDLDYGLTLGHTFVISPTLVNSLRVGANRTNIAKVPDQYKSFGALGANVSPLGGNNIALSVTSEFAIGGGAAAPGVSHNGPLWSVGDDVNWVKGSHQIGFGGSFYHQQLNYWSGGGVNATGLANFDGSVSGLALADFMLGRFVSWSQGTLYGFYSRQTYQALYVQDSWKITPRLTANFGVRWEPYTAVYQSRTAQDLHFDSGLFAQNVHSAYYQNAPAGLVFSGDPQYSCGNSFNCSKWDKFFPRVGLAWDPKGDGKTVVRVAYGMFGDRMSMLSLSQEQFGAPFGNTVSATGGTLANPWSNYPGLTGGASQPGQNPMAVLASRSGFGYAAPNIPFPAFGAYVGSNLSNFQPTYVNQWNLSIQRQIGQNWLLSANYLGTSTIHFVSGENLNASVLVPNTAGTPLGTCPKGVVVGCNSTGNANQRRPLYLQNSALGQYYSNVGIADDGGTASYEGLYLSAQKRLSHGVTVQANYTWSHCISDPWNQNPTAAGVAPPGARRQWRSNCIGSDLRQLFSLNAVATTPKFSSRALRLVASDWQVAPIMTIKSAQFFSVLAGPDRALTTVPGQPAQLLSASPYAAKQTVDQWLNPSAFGQPDLGTYGNLGLNNLKGPGVFQLNMSLSRTFPVAEHKSFQLRGEAFNLPNHLNPFTPGITPINGTLFGGQQNQNAPNFGQITSDISGNNGLLPGDYRVIQFALKFVF